MSKECIKLYTKDQCDALGGNWYENGECLKKEGGSYSWDNRTIKKPVIVEIQLTETTIVYSNVKSVVIKDLSGNQLYVSK